MIAITVKKYISIICCVVFILSMAGCSNEDDNDVLITEEYIRAEQSSSEESQSEDSQSEESQSEESQSEESQNEVDNQAESNIAQATTEEQIPSQPDPPPPVIIGETSYTFRRNEDATIYVTGAPNTEYDISVYYKSGESEAEGLENKTSDSSGNISWTWHIGGRTTHGTYNATITGGGQTFKVAFEVVD